jgi:hypothetical protein
MNNEERRKERGERSLNFFEILLGSTVCFPDT